MKYLKLLGITLVIPMLILAISSVSFGGDENETLKKGEALFTKNGCNKCHAEGKKLSKVPTKEEYKQAGALEKVINLCLQGPAKAQPIDPASEDMKNLKAYIEHLALHATPEGSEPTHEGSEHMHEGSQPKAQ